MKYNFVPPTQFHSHIYGPIICTSYMLVFLLSLIAALPLGLFWTHRRVVSDKDNLAELCVTCAL